ncbi:hypothetical protein, variant [Capsaspora owczarzaki ATCC 30864]|nr:hypothetical protein, variant [Capsaspora owczarzaki ATCC 30864]
MRPPPSALPVPAWNVALLDYDECNKDTPAYRTALRGCEIRIDTARRHLERVKQATADCCEQVAAYNEAQHKLAKLAADAPVFSKNSDAPSEVASTISAVSEMFTRLHALRFTLMEEMRGLIHAPAEDFVTNEARIAREHKDQLKVTAGELDVAIDRHGGFSKSQMDKKVESFQEVSNRMWQLREMSTVESLEYTEDVNRMGRHQQTLSYDALVNYLNCQLRYFKGGLALIEGIQNELTQLETVSAQLRQKEAAELSAADRQLQRIRTQELSRIKRQRTRPEGVPIKFETTDALIWGELFKREVLKDGKEVWLRRYFSIDNGLLVYRTRPRVSGQGKEGKAEFARQRTSSMLRQTAAATAAARVTGGLTGVSSSRVSGAFSDGEESGQGSPPGTPGLRAGPADFTPDSAACSPNIIIPGASEASPIGEEDSFSSSPPVSSLYLQAVPNRRMANSRSEGNVIATSPPSSGAITPRKSLSRHESMHRHDSVDPPAPSLDLYEGAINPPAAIILPGAANPGTSSPAIVPLTADPLLPLEIDSPVLISNMSLCSVRPAAHKDRMHVFEVITPSEKTFLQADSDDEVAEWIAVLQNAIAASLEVETIPSAQRDAGAAKALMQQIRGVPGNGHCADCGRADPDWASINLGILICIECSGVHRRMGVHITKVRSLTLDKWGSGLLRMMASVGNQLANSVFEARLAGQGVTRPATDAPSAVREEFIRSKYEHKRFCHKNVLALRAANPATDLETASTPQQIDEALHDAAAVGDLRWALHAIALGGSPQYARDLKGSATCLHAAAIGNFTALAHLLVQNGADVRLPDSTGATSASIMKSLEEYA